MRKRWLSLLPILLITALLLAACGGDKPPAAADGDGAAGDGDVIKLGVLLPTSGDLGWLGAPMADAAKLAVKLVNAQEGILGRQVEAVVVDTQTDEIAARDGIEYLINIEGVRALVGAAGSGETMAALAQAVPEQVVMISPSATSPDFTTYEDDGFFFRTAPSDSLQGAVMGKLTYDDGCRTASSIALNNPYGVGFKNVFAETFTSLGGEVVADILFDPQGTTFTSEVNQLADAAADCVVVVAYPETGSIVLREAFTQGVLDVDTWYLSEGLQSGDLAGLVGKDDDGKFVIEGIRGTQPKAVGGDVYEAFVAAYTEEYGEPPTGPFEAHTYDAALLIMFAMEQAGSTDGPAVRDNVQSIASPTGEEVSDIGAALALIRAGTTINYEGASGSVDMDGVGDVTSLYEAWQVLADGTIQIIGDAAVPQ